ncbi:hypothetical protein L9F63_025337, partial [Diploptera punctata]
ALNTTLGLGPNRISVLLQDTVSGATLNTYLLTLHRYTSAHTEPAFQSNNKYAVCGLRQECEYRISPGEPCGLQMEEESGIATWTETLDSLKQLPECSSGDAI